MLIMPRQGESQENTKNYQKALAYAKKGYSVIPIYMREGREKLPRGFNDTLLPWNIFQEHPATPEILKKWYEAGLFSEGLAIITGDISKLLPIDFDDYELADEFATEFPELAKTYRVQTRRGIHFYFRPADDLKPRSQKLTKIDVKYNGGYVVAPPTENYVALADEDNIQTLSRADYFRILKHFETRKEEGRAGAQQFDAQHIPTLAELINIYKSMSSQGRNNALFETVKLARDFGYLPHDLLNAGLQDIFVYEKSFNSSEKPQARMQEYTRTVASVYSRTPRQLRRDLDILRISDDARERLHRDGQSDLVRVLDAVLLTFDAGAHITMRDLYEALDGIIAWKVIRRALDATFEGKLVFHRAPLSPRPTPLEANAGTSTTINAYSRVTKREKSKTGRNPMRFIVPSAQDIQRITGAQKRYSTPITLEDLSSPQSYKVKLDVGRIQRSSHYKGHANTWRAGCLNVSIRTVQRYTKIADYDVRENHNFIRSIDWHSIQSLDTIPPSSGYFLKDEFGRKYRPDTGTASRLILARRTLTLWRQGTNHYSIKGCQTDKPTSKTFSKDLADLMARYEQGIRGDALNNIDRPEKLNPELLAKSADYWNALKPPQVDTPPDIPSVETDQDKQLCVDDLFHPDGTPKSLESLAIALNRVDYLLDKQGLIDYSAGIQGVLSEPGEKAIQRRKWRDAEEAAKTLTMLVPDRTLSHEKARELIVRFGDSTCLQAAMKINYEYQMGKKGKRAIKNPVAVLIYRLKLNGRTHA